MSKVDKKCNDSFRWNFYDLRLDNIPIRVSIHGLNMLGSNDQRGLGLPDILKSKSDNIEDLSVNGTKPHPVKPYNHNRNVMLPHISQKSQRPPPPKPSSQKLPGETEQGSMLEAIEIYRRARQESANQGTAQPCPTPNEFAMDHDQLGFSGDERNIPPGSVQKRLENLAKNKSRATKLSKLNHHGSTKLNPSNSSMRSDEMPLPSIKGETKVPKPYYGFDARTLPRFRRNPRQASISYQLLEIPTKLARPEKKSMFSRDHYDDYQHNKFSPRQDNKKLSIVGGPDSGLQARWDYNKFLYLNVKI